MDGNTGNGAVLAVGFATVCSSCGVASIKEASPRFPLIFVGFSTLLTWLKEFIQLYTIYCCLQYIYTV
jgi:hypothetical protein